MMQPNMYVPGKFVQHKGSILVNIENGDRKYCIGLKTYPFLNTFFNCQESRIFLASNHQPLLIQFTYIRSSCSKQLVNIFEKYYKSCKVFTRLTSASSINTCIPSYFWIHVHMLYVHICKSYAHVVKNFLSQLINFSTVT